MIYNVCINGTAIVGFDILALAKSKAEKFSKEYPTDKITVEWTHYWDGSKTSYEVLEINP